MSPSWTEEEFHNWCRQLGGNGFEDFLEELFSELGWHVKSTGANDYGVDLYLSEEGFEQGTGVWEGHDVLVQAKNHEQKVGSGSIQRLAGMSIAVEPERIQVISVSGFTDRAGTAKRLIDPNSDFDIELLDSDDLFLMTQTNELLDLLTGKP